MQTDRRTDGPTPWLGGDPDEFLRTSRILREIERVTGQRFNIDPRRLATMAAANLLPELEQRGAQQFWGAERRHLPAIAGRLAAAFARHTPPAETSQVAA